VSAGLGSAAVCRRRLPAPGAARPGDREIPYQQLPPDMVRQWAGEEVATMFESFENTTDFLDIETLHARYPAVRWHSYAEWAEAMDWDAILAG
jgi:hypothetical protein